MSNFYNGNPKKLLEIQINISLSLDENKVRLHNQHLEDKKGLKIKRKEKINSQVKNPRL